jgi:hypothetical protein
MNFAQHRIASGIIAAVSIWVCWISFTQKPAEAFLFPRVISVFFLIFALWTFGRAVLGLSRVGNGLTRETFKNMVPGLVIGSVYIFWAAKALGFYTSATIVFFLLLPLYDPAPNQEAKTWIKRGLITLGFLAIMYILFAMILKVFTPRGMFI